ncbi:MAG TPA: RNA polymerase sigma-70 factor [Mycobacteriales bacterium]|jgi:RNA polymerase sigma-70 factor (ECF subfamily)|nr:RNA polymerase sigma-70 factor [Mycobacteriales bacterium]
MTDTWAPEDLRGYAFAVAYRMLGSVGEAEDVVQEAMIRLHAADRSEVRSPTAYTATVTTRLALDELRSARARRERYVGTWLPEPVLGEPGPAERAELRESLAAAFLLVLETLGPVERAVFVLHDLFDLPYGEVAEVVDRSEATCRQIAARARRHVAARQQRYDPPAEQRDRLVRRFFAALDAGDVAGLERMLAADVVFHGDGGGKGPAIKQPVFGPLRVARLLAGIVRQAQRYGLRLEPAVVNDGPGARMLDPDDRLLNVLALDVRDGQVVAVRSVINPDKLRHLGPLVPLTELSAR